MKQKNLILDFNLLITSKIEDILNSSPKCLSNHSNFKQIKDTKKKNKSYAFVGLPEHIASLRVLKYIFLRNLNILNI